MTPRTTTVSDASRRRVEQGMPALARLATAQMEANHPWYRALSAEDRSWVGLVAQAGIAAFLGWFSDPDEQLAITADVFGTAPRELTRSVTLRETLDLVRTVVGVVEDQVEQMAAPGEEQALRESVLRYSREIAVAAAEVYAQAAEARGAWDARLESLVVDAVLRGEADDALQSRAAALGWDAVTGVVVVAGWAGAGSAAEALEALRRQARRLDVDALGAVQGGRLVTVLGGVERPLLTATELLPCFADGAVVVGPIVPHLFAAGRSARAAMSGLVAARGWPEAPRPVLADDLLPERVLSGDSPARRALVDRVHRPLEAAGGSLLQTVTTYLETGGSLEASARLLFVHPNTVRYRLRRVIDVCGYDVTTPRDAHVVKVATTLGRLADAPRRQPAPEQPVL
ncbi:MAG TPA: helix-turn-helix domain-containing protein [Actinomycetales bacterium]